MEDASLTTRVKAALLADADIRDDNIKVEANQGEVVLSGSVDNPEQLKRALEVASAVEGVRNIQNEIRVGN